MCNQNDGWSEVKVNSTCKLPRPLWHVSGIELKNRFHSAYGCQLPKTAKELLILYKENSILNAMKF